MLTIANDYLSLLQKGIGNIDISEVVQIASLINDACKNGNQVFVFGNGGSGSTASHFACDINKGVSYSKGKRHKIICLNDNIPTMLAYSNDIGYEIVFVEQLKNLLNEGDIVIGISGSGNSKNVLLAIEYANNNNAITVGLTGFDGGQLKKMSKYSFNAAINDMQVSEDMHMVFVHLMMKCLS